VQEVFARAASEPDFVKGTKTIVDWVNARWSTIYDGTLRVAREFRPDLLVVDVATTAGLDAAETLGLPVVLNNADVLPTLSEALLAPAPDVPMMFSGRSCHGRPKWWTPTVHKAVRALGLALARKAAAASIEPYRATRGLAPVDPLLRARGLTVLVNTAFPLEYQRPIPPDVHLVGPMLDDTEPALDQPLLRWLDDGPPVAFVNLGTLAMPDDSLVLRIAEGLKDGGFRSLWVLRGTVAERMREKVGDSVRICDWVPSQLNLLRHPKVKAFVSHCGVNSVHESIAAGVPVVGIPLFADQKDMGLRAADSGVARLLDKTRFKPQDLREAIRGVLNDAESFSPRMQALQDSFVAAGGVERATSILEEKLRRALACRESA
jgi:polyene glycosyltransferase